MRKKFFIFILCIMSCTISSGQNRRGYAIDPQLKILSYFNPPVSKAIAPVASVFMDLMPKKIDKEDIIYESFKADITQASLQERIRFLSESFSNRHCPT